mmetsp:Transcript_47129/g.109833  ORF Transcript_47129/g.109833 Transcript_47129/m.109833 type:complete len:173 (+) Transcript_47129:302-820(+)
MYGDRGAETLELQPLSREPIGVSSAEAGFWEEAAKPSACGRVSHSGGTGGLVALLASSRSNVRIHDGRESSDVADLALVSSGCGERLGSAEDLAGTAATNALGCEYADAADLALTASGSGIGPSAARDTEVPAAREAVGWEYTDVADLALASSGDGSEAWSAERLDPAEAGG